MLPRIGWWIPIAVAAAAAGCGSSPPRAAEGKHAAVRTCDYDVVQDPSRELSLDIRVRCPGLGLVGLRTSDDLIARRVRARASDGRPLRTNGPMLALDSGEADGFDYQVDLDAIAVDHSDPEVADRVGNSWIAPASTWLLRPEPAQSDISVRVRVRSRSGFATALASTGDGYALLSHQLRTATYAVFGAFRERSVEVPGRAGTQTQIRVVTLDGRFDSSDALLSDWVQRSAACVATFFGGFPTERAMIALIPAPGQESVAWGALLPENGAGIAMLVGQRADRRSLDHDWILVHELFHVGVPSFIGEGKWLDEGLATYYEPIIRARAGVLRELDVWSEFARNMPRAAPALKNGLEKTDDWSARYWGGATVVLLADLAARRQSQGKRGIEDGLRRVLDEGGDARRIWKLERVYATVDDALGAPILATLGERYAAHGGSVDFAQLFAELGVQVRGNAVQLSDQAPLAALRRAIVWGRGF
jgi:hypothetical protein